MSDDPVFASLRARDIAYLEDGWERTPDDHITGLLRLRTRRWRRWASIEEKAEACRRFIPIVTEWLAPDTRAPHLKAALAGLQANSSPKEVLHGFQEITVGFSASDVRKEERHVLATRKRLLRTISRMAGVHATAQAVAKKRGDATSELIRRLYIEKLEEERCWVEEKFSPTGLAGLALHALRSRRDARRCPRKYVAHCPVADDYENDADWCEARLERYSPRFSQFPFRFCKSLPLRTLRALRLEWLENPLSPALLPMVEADLDWREFFGECTSALRLLEGVVASERVQAISELERCWELRLAVSTATLASTQAEGLLWDFARYLNQTRKPVFKTVRDKRLPYEWDYSKGCYKHLNSRGRPSPPKKVRPMNSAQALLANTRVGSYMPLEIHEFLMHDHYRDRCSYAHGDLKARHPDADAVVALLSLREVIAVLEHNRS